jgi:hypothetical protein
MKLVRGTIACLSLVAAWAGWAREAAAFTPPAFCTSVRNVAGYNTGVAGGTSITNAAWNGVGQDPDRIGDLQAAITGALTSAAPTTTAVYVLCRFAGIYDGALARLAQLQADVINQCVLEGTWIGYLQAQLYCGISIDLQGIADLGAIIRPPAGLCGSNFEVSCDADFDTEAAAYPGCGPYITGGFAGIATHYRDLQCTY